MYICTHPKSYMMIQKFKEKSRNSSNPEIQKFREYCDHLCMYPCTFFRETSVNVCLTVCMSVSGMYESL